MAVRCELRGQQCVKKLAVVATARDAVATRQGGNVLGNISDFVLFRLCNITSIQNKHAAVKLCTAVADVTALVETKDCDSFPDNYFANLTSFNVFRRPRNSNGGGVAVVIRKCLKPFRRVELEPSDLEVLVVDLTRANLLVLVFYGPPRTIQHTIPELIEHVRTFAHEDLQRLILLGDFNCPDVDWPSRSSSSSEGCVLVNACREFNLKQIVNFPT